MKDPTSVADFASGMQRRGVSFKASKKSIEQEELHNRVQSFRLAGHVNKARARKLRASGMSKSLKRWLP